MYIVRISFRLNFSLVILCTYTPRVAGLTLTAIYTNVTSNYNELTPEYISNNTAKIVASFPGNPTITNRNKPVGG